MFTLLHKWLIDRSVRAGKPSPGWTRRAEARSRELQAFRARLTRLETCLRAGITPARPGPHIRQAVLDAARSSPGPSAASRPHHARPTLWLAAAAAALLVAMSAWIALRPSAPGAPSEPIAIDDRPPARPALPDTGIATVLSARPDLAAAAPLLQEARRLEADTRAVRDRLLARIPLIHERADRAGDL